MAAVHSGDWLNRMTSDTVVVANGMVQIFPGLAGMAVKLVGASAMILVLEPRFAYFILPGGLLLVGFWLGCFFDFRSDFLVVLWI